MLMMHLRNKHDGSSQDCSVCLYKEPLYKGHMYYLYQPMNTFRACCHALIFHHTHNTYIHILKKPFIAMFISDL